MNHFNTIFSKVLINIFLFSFFPDGLNVLWTLIFGFEFDLINIFAGEQNWWLTLVGRHIQFCLRDIDAPSFPSLTALFWFILKNFKKHK